MELDEVLASSSCCASQKCKAVMLLLMRISGFGNPAVPACVCLFSTKTAYSFLKLAPSRNLSTNSCSWKLIWTCSVP